MPNGREKWFRTLFSQFDVKVKTLSAKQKADLALAKLIDEAMEEEGEVPKEKIEGFIKKYGRKV